MTTRDFTLACTQAPHVSFENGGVALSARQFFGRLTQHTVNGPRIASAVAGMAPGEFRAIWADASGGIFSVRRPDSTGGTLNTLDWNPLAAWDATTEQIVVGGKRIMYKLIAYSDVTGDWRELPMPLPLGKETGTGHWYGNTAHDGAGRVFLRDYIADTDDESYTRTAAPPSASNTGPGSLTWLSIPGRLARVTPSNFQVYDPVSDTWPVNVSGLGHDDHVLASYHATHRRTLLIGGSTTRNRVTLVDETGAFVQGSDAPVGMSMSPSCWVLAHPSGCWLVRSGDSSPASVWAAWPNETLNDVTWEEIGEAPDSGLTYPTAVFDPARGLVYIVATTGLYAWAPPAVTDPSGAQHESGGADAVVSVVATGAGTAAEAASGGGDAVVAVIAVGEGFSTESGAQHESGGGDAIVAVVATGAGAAAEHASGGGSATVQVIAVGGGISSEGAGTADPAAVWAYVLSNGKTAEQTLLEVHAMLYAQGSASDIAAAVLAAMNSTPPGVDVKRVNGVVLQGTGVTGDSMRPA